MYACVRGDEAMVQMLLDAGADLNVEVRVRGAAGPASPDFLFPVAFTSHPSSGCGPGKTTRPQPKPQVATQSPCACFISRNSCSYRDLWIALNDQLLAPTTRTF